MKCYGLRVSRHTIIELLSRGNKSYEKNIRSMYNWEKGGFEFLCTILRISKLD